MVRLLHADTAPAGYVPAPAAPIPELQKVPAILPIKFWTEYKYPIGYDPTAAENEGKTSTFVEEDWVEWVKKGEQGGSRTQEAIKRLKPNPARGRRAAIEWMVVGPAYEAWKRGEENPTTGTPLYAWGGISREMCDVLKKYNIFSIQDLADFPDHNLSKVPLPSLREYRSRAKAWREAQGTSDVGAKLAERDKIIEAQAASLAETQGQVVEMKAMMAAMQSQIGQAATSLQPKGPNPDDEFVQIGPDDVPASAPRRGSGRPPKEAT